LVFDEAGEGLCAIAAIEGVQRIEKSPDIELEDRTVVGGSPILCGPVEAAIGAGDEPALGELSPSSPVNAWSGVTMPRASSLKMVPWSYNPPNSAVPYRLPLGPGAKLEDGEWPSFPAKE